MIPCHMPVSHSPSGRINAANPALTVTDTISTDIPSTSAVAAAVTNAAKSRPSGETSCLALVAEAEFPWHETVGTASAGLGAVRSECAG